MRPLVDHVPRETRRAVDLTSLGVAFGATPSLRLIGLSVDGILLAQPEIRDAGCRYASTHLAGVTSGQGADLARGSGVGGQLTKEFTAAY